MNATTTPDQALADLFATAPKPTFNRPTKTQQKDWFEQYVVRNVRGQVVYSVKTWNPDALAMATARAETLGGTFELIAEGRVAA